MVLFCIASVVASALDRLGAEGRALYKQACKKGKVRIDHVLIDVMGEEEAGKSCLSDSIMDKPYVPSQSSTKGVKMNTIVRRAVGHNAEWKEVNDEERHAVIDRLFAKGYVLRKNERATAQPTTQLRESEKATAHPLPEQHKERQSEPGFFTRIFRRFWPSQSALTSDAMKKQDHQSQISSEGVPISTMGFEEFKSAQVLNEEVAKVISLMEENAEEFRKCEEMVVINMMDRGGQDQYLAIHAALTADSSYNASVCLFVLDGSKPLDETVTESKFRLAGGGEIKQKRDVATTGAHLIRHWDAAVDASRPYDADLPPQFLGMKHVKRPPATFMIATRKDKTKGKHSHVNALERNIQQIVSEEMFGHHVVASGRNPYTALFHVDNTRSGAGNPDPTVVEIREIIVEMTREFWKEQPLTPLPWAMLDKGLGRLAMSKCKVIAFKDVCTLAKRVCDIASDEECREALRYLCSLGTICYYHDVPGLSDKVLPNTQWVANVLSVFVTVLDYTCFPLYLWHHLHNLQEEGLMAWELAEHLLQEAEVEKADYITLLILLQLFNVISPALLMAPADAAVKPGQNFFVPSMVAKEFINNKEPAYRSAICSSSCPPPLFLAPKGSSAFLKPLFYRLISRLVAKYNSKPILTRNQVLLHLPGNLELELFYTTKAVIATVYPFDSSDLPSQNIIRRSCVNARVHLVQELTLAKRRGMDGFQFELCVHSTTNPESPEVVFEEIACLDHYPTHRTLVTRKGHRIRPPHQLDLWYTVKGSTSSEAIPLSVERVLAGNTSLRKPLSKVTQLVIRHGQNQWYAFGVALGYTAAEIESICSNKSTDAERLLAMMHQRTGKIGQKKMDRELLEACKNLPSPIYGTVEDQL